MYIHGQDGVGEYRSDKCWSECGGGRLWMPEISVDPPGVSPYSDFIPTHMRSQETLNGILFSELNGTSLTLTLHKTLPVSPCICMSDI